MKIQLKKKHLGTVLVCAAGLFLLAVGVTAAEDQAFETERAEMPAKLSRLRTRVDAAGGENLSLALLLASQNKDARLVVSTVLVYQEYPRERRLAVLLASAIRFYERLEVMQRVTDAFLEKMLVQAPPDMEGINGMFEAVNNLLVMNPVQLHAAVASTRQEVKGLDFAQTAVKNSVKRKLGGQQTTRADQD